MPALRAAARLGRAHLPAAERPPDRPCLTAPAGQRGGRGQRPRSARSRRTPLTRLRLRHSSCSARATIEVEGRLVAASNATLYCTVRHDGRQAACVYKPVAGERPLWDFAAGSLAGREVAAYRVSAAAGLRIVPPTVLRDGPFGPGMCQLWIDADESVDIIALARRSDHAGLRDMAVFDAVVNNADRKIGHLLPAPGRPSVRLRPRRLLRRGVQAAHRAVAVARPQPARAGRAGAAAAAVVLRDRGPGRRADRACSPPDEVDATRQRLELLLKHRVHPYPPEDWPAVPWPPVGYGGHWRARISPQADDRPGTGRISGRRARRGCPGGAGTARTPWRWRRRSPPAGPSRPLPPPAS